MATKPYSPPFERRRILSPKPEAQWGESGTEKWSMQLRCGGRREQPSDSEKLEEERLIISSSHLLLAQPSEVGTVDEETEAGG